LPREKRSQLTVAERFTGAFTCKTCSVTILKNLLSRGWLGT
jgi:hypothetical protein